MHRRTLLTGAAASSVTALAGCLADGRGGSDPADATDDGTATPTPEPCERGRIDRPEPGAEIEARRLPERPDEWTEATVETYVREYEAAYRQWLILTPATTAYGHSESLEAIERTDGGFEVRVETHFYYEEDTDEGLVHADSPRYTVTYRVLPDRLRRAEAERYDEDADPETGTTVECW